MGVGRFHISVPVIAITVSAAVHAGLLTAAHFVPLRSQDVIPPVIQIPQGEHAIRVTIVSAATSEQEQNDPPSADKPDSENQTAAAANTVAACIPPHESAAQPVVLQTQTIEPQVHVVDTGVGQIEADPVKPTTAASPSPPIDIHLPNPIATIPDLPVVPSTPTKPVHPPPTRIPSEQSAQPPVSIQTATAPKPIVTRSKTQSPVAKKQSESQPPGVRRGAKTLKLPRPIYPSISRRRGEQGLVVLRVEVLPNGTVGKIKTLSDAGFARLARAAINAVRKARFRPATLDGRPVKDTVRVPFRFVLR